MRSKILLIFLLVCGLCGMAAAKDFFRVTVVRAGKRSSTVKVKDGTTITFANPGGRRLLQLGKSYTSSFKCDRVQWSYVFEEYFCTDDSELTYVINGTEVAVISYRQSKRSNFWLILALKKATEPPKPPPLLDADIELP